MRKSGVSAVFALALGLTGCSGTTTAQPAKHTTAPVAPTAPIVAPTSNEPVTETGKDVRVWLRENYPGADFLPFITRIYLVGSSIWADTSIYADAEGKEAAAPICSALRAYDYSERDGSGSASVRAPSGQQLVNCG